MITRGAHAQSTEDVFRQFGTGADGLSAPQIRKRRKEFGINELPETGEVRRWQILISQFKSPIVLLLFVAAIISYFFGDLTETIAILFVILINGLIGYILESQAMRSMRALRKLDKTFCRVRRGGAIHEIEAGELVPGDMVLLEAGDLVPADGRLIAIQRLQVNEASLTGESVPVEKESSAILPEDTMLAERRNMAYKGTSVTKGTAEMVVTGTGLNTEIGEISKMVESAQKDEIPLNKKLNAFGKKLIWVTLVLIIIFLVLGLIRGRDLYEILETAIALSVAAIPEGLPIVATISLAKGMLELARHNVIIKKLAAVETLGETDIIITDKTGTLTENKLRVDEIVPESNPEDLLVSSVLCNNASRISNGEFQGDPVEVALLEYYEAQEPDSFSKLQSDWEEIEELPFDSDFKYMANLYQGSEGFVTVAKGSPAVILELCDHISSSTELNEKVVKDWLARTEALASKGLKVLGFAIRYWKTKPNHFNQGLRFAGIIGFIDPARTDVPPALADCHDAGIRVIMATGDHPSTALAIARQTGLTRGEKDRVLNGGDIDNLEEDEWAEKISNSDILSRVTPRQKLEVVTYYQSIGHIVGMTGDGVNDAPALKKADIGIAMGMRGTQVAEEAADMVLQDDAFPSIVQAIRQGRIIFRNIQNFVIYLLSCNLSEIMVVSLATLFTAVLPLLPLQILFLNIVTDVFPALALGMGGGGNSIMQHHSRNPSDPILSRGNWKAIFLYAATMTLFILGAFFYSMRILDYQPAQINSIAFFSLAFAQLLHPFNLVSGRESFLSNPVMKNRYLWAAIVLCSLILAVSLWIDPLREVLGLVKLSSGDWLIVFAASVLPVLFIRILKTIFRHE